MIKAPIPPLIDYFKDIKDPRIDRNKDTIYSDKI